MTKTVSDQKAWERDMVSLGVSRFRATEEKAKSTGRFTDTSSGGRLIRVYLSQVSSDIAERVNRKTTRNKYFKLLKGIDCDKLAMFALYRVIECVYKPQSAPMVAAAIGKMVEDELRFSKFEIETPEYYNAVQRDLDARNSNSYKHRHRVLVSTMNSKGIEWNSWTNETHVGVGSVLLEAVRASTDLVEFNRGAKSMMVTPTQEAIDWIVKHDEVIELMLPDRMPCIVQPREWTEWKDGGFYTRKLSNLTPLVKTRAGQHRDNHAPLLDTAAMPVVLNAVNGMQNTPWMINPRILAVVREVWDRGLELGMPRSQPYEIPPAPVPEGKKAKDLTPDEKVMFDEWKAEARTLHNMESDRKAKLMATVRAMRMASRLDTLDMMWIVYQLDFRGRGYCTTSGVSPQGADVSKSLLQFARPHKLTERGWYWFQVHGANKYGYDKENYDDRIAWVQSNRDAFILAGTDPLAATDTWANADKPYQFLAWCMEFAAAHRQAGGFGEFQSRIPIALDGSCNGLQHFSAMLRDPVGGQAVNLTPGSKPADIYSDVAAVATRTLRQRATDPADPEYALVANWVGYFDKYFEGKMNRKVTKTPVMTLPYGSTLQTCTQSVHTWLLDQGHKYLPEGTLFRHSIVLAKIIWKSIGEVVIAARTAMDWLQKCARALAKEDQPIVYVNPIGFPLVQFSPKMETYQIETQIGGRYQIRMKRELPGIDRYKAANGASPNLVHNVDSAHMMMVVAAALLLGIVDFAMIHDDFGVPAQFVDMFHKVIREQFVKLHSTNILADFKAQQEARTGITLPDLPVMGDLDLSQVLDSPYFFG